MKNKIEKILSEIDREIKDSTGVDLARLSNQLNLTRRSFRILDLEPVVIGSDIFLVKAKIKNLVH